MNTNTIIAAIALSLIANSALAQRSTGTRAKPGADVRVETPRERTERLERERAQQPGRVDAATSRQQNAEMVRARADIDTAFNGSAMSKSLTNKEGLYRLHELNPMSGIPQILKQLVDLQVSLAARPRGVEGYTYKIVTKTLEALNQYGVEALSNPKFRTEEVKQEIADLASAIRGELMDATVPGKWPAERLKNLNGWAEALAYGALQGLTPREATNRYGKFTWEEFIRRCKKA